MNVAAPTSLALTDAQRLAWLRLIRSENVGPAAFRGLVNMFGSAEAALDALPHLSRRGGSTRRIRVASVADAEREMAGAARLGARFVALGEAAYPLWLRHADAPPPLLAVRGSPMVLARPAIAIVGARNASAAGRKMAATLSRALGEAGLVVVSGLARGIDAEAHEAALLTGTVAVFAGGLDIVYPPENERLLSAILEAGGAAVSEMPFGWKPRDRDFPRRNRIIAGIGMGTLVVEAAERSGSLITARLALEANREVMAVPGSPLDPRAAGTNGLLKKGARLVTEAKDVLEALGPQLGPRFEPPAPRAARAEEPAGLPAAETDPAESDRARVLQALGPAPLGIDEIARFAGVPARLMQVILLELDLAGRIERHPGNLVSLR